MELDLSWTGETFCDTLRFQNNSKVLHECILYMDLAVYCCWQRKKKKNICLNDETVLCLCVTVDVPLSICSWFKKATLITIGAIHHSGAGVCSHLENSTKCIHFHLILVRVAGDVESTALTMGVRQKYTLDGIPGHDAHTHSRC